MEALLMLPPVLVPSEFLVSDIGSDLGVGTLCFIEPLALVAIAVVVAVAGGLLRLLYDVD